LANPIPPEHVEDALKLEADAEIDLYELFPLAGGTIYFKNDNNVTWLGHEYEGIPCSMTGEEFDTEKSPTPTLEIGQPDLDLLPFKGLIHDGYLDGATLVRKTVLLQNLLDNLNIRQTAYFRVKRVPHYSRTSVSMELASFSSAQGQTIPFRQYIPPAFPWVDT
jgi:phage-related protein